MRHGLVRISLVLFGLGLAAPADASVVALQPLGRLDRGLLSAVAARIERSYAVRVVILPTRPLPPSAFYEPRRRYRGDRLVAWLEARKPRSAVKVLGLMTPDLSVTKANVHDWGVMGVAGLSGPAGVVSVHRLRARGATAARVARRAGQVSVHELGHTFGLSHCPSAGCIMNDARGGIGPVDRSRGTFCRRCRDTLEKRGVVR